MANATNTVKKIPTVAATIDTSGLTLKFKSGQVLTIALSQLSEDNREYAAYHGLKQKLVDAAAIKCNPDTGLPATAQEKYEAVREIYDRLVSGGSWNAERKGVATGSNTDNLLIRALAQLSNKPIEAIRAYVATKSKEEKAGLKADARIAGVILEMQRAAVDVDTESMLEELGIFDGEAGEDEDVVGVDSEDGGDAS